MIIACTIFVTIFANEIMWFLLNIQENIRNPHNSYLAYHVFDPHP
jgi:hypothetical protein